MIKHRRQAAISTRCLFALVALALAFTCTASTSVFARSHFAKGTAEPAEDNLKQGIDLMKKGNYEAAIDSFIQSGYYARNGYNPQAYMYMGLCYKALRKYPKAIEAFNRHLSQTTEKAPDVHLDLAECYMNIHDFEKARDEIDKSFSEQDKKGTWRQKFVSGELEEKIAEGENRPDAVGQALEFYDAAIEQKAHYTEAWMGKARVQVKMKRWNDAIESYRHILDEGVLMHPDLTELYYGMGTCFLARGDHQGALDHWHMALEQNPDCFDAHLSIANLLFDEKHFSSAQKEYEAALRTMLPTPKAEMQRDAIHRRLLWLEQALKPREAPVVMKPSPSMRQEYEESVRPTTPINQPPPKGDTGF